MSVVKFILPSSKIAKISPKVTVASSSKLNYLQNTKFFLEKMRKNVEQEVTKFSLDKKMKNLQQEVTKFPLKSKVKKLEQKVNNLIKY